MRRTISRKEIDAIFDNPKLATQSDICIALYRLAFPNWDDIASLDSWPTCGRELGLYVMDRFMKFDRQHHPSVMNGGLWMNKGWAIDDTLGPWELSTDTAGVHLAA